MSIHIGLAFLLAAFCLFILRSFVLLIAWSIIIAVASYPVFLKLQNALGGLAAVLYTMILLAILIIPMVLPAALNPWVNLMPKGTYNPCP